MRRIAVINQKGGVGKTTTAANLGAALARSGRRVLLIDLDPQAHLTLHFGVELTDDQPSAYDVLIESARIDKVAQALGENLMLIHSDIDLAAAESELVSVMGREVIFREALNAVDGDHDVMLIDCPPSLGILTINALVAAREVIIPLQAQFFALQGLSKLLDTVTLVKQRINPALTVSGVALCMHESNTRLANEVVQDLGQFLELARGTAVPWADARIYKTRIRRNIKLAEASSFGQAIFDYEPRSNGAADYAALAVEIFPELRAAAARWCRTIEPPPQAEVDATPTLSPDVRLPARIPPAPTPAPSTLGPETVESAAEPASEHLAETAVRELSSPDTPAPETVESASESASEHLAGTALRELSSPATPAQAPREGLPSAPETPASDTVATGAP